MKKASRAAVSRMIPGRLVILSGPSGAGKTTLHDLLLRWLPRLTPDGHAVMVVGKNLGADSLQAWLTAQGWPTTRLSSARGFRILRTQRT